MHAYGSQGAWPSPPVDQVPSHIVSFWYFRLLVISFHPWLSPYLPLVSSSASTYGLHSMSHPGVSGFLPHHINAKGESGASSQAPNGRYLLHPLLLCCSKTSWAAWEHRKSCGCSWVLPQCVWVFCCILSCDYSATRYSDDL